MGVIFFHCDGRRSSFVYYFFLFPLREEQRDREGQAGDFMPEGTTTSTFTITVVPQPLTFMRQKSILKFCAKENNSTLKPKKARSKG